MNTLENPTVSLADGYYRDVFEHAPDGMYSINANGVIVECNETWANMLGSTKADIIGRRSVDLLTPASKEKAATLLPIFFREGEMHDVAFQYVRGDGSVLGAELSATLHDDPSTGRRFSRAIVRAVPEEVPPAFGRMDRESSEPKLSTVILAIEDPALREVCRQRLRTEGHAVVALDRTLALLTLPRTLNYDLVCVDGSAFGTDVLKMLDERRQGRVPVVGIGVEREGLAASLPLPLDGERLRITIEEIVRRKAGGERQEAVQLDAAHRTAFANGREVALTRTEYRLLAYLLQHRPKEVPLPELLDAVWGFTEGRGASVLVQAHVRNLRLKLARIGLADAVRSRRGRGYAFVL